MTPEDFKTHAHQIVDWMAAYMAEIESYPVRSKADPGQIMATLPQMPPETATPVETILSDFEDLLLPGITHWQHPKFFAYFPATTSPPSILAEMLIAAMSVQCMSWQTSPSGTELETRMMQWLAKAIGLPENFEGAIQDSASSATLCAILCAREQATNFQSNSQGLNHSGRLTFYCSEEAHSSVDKAIKVTGIGIENLKKIPTDARQSLKPDELRKAIEADRASGALPAGVIATLGTTGSSGFDNLKHIGEICAAEKLWLHVDAAWAGSAMILPEYRYLMDGIESADSFVFNPHKWLYTSFDCSAFYVRNKNALLQTLSITPEYLKTREDDWVINYRDWSIPLGRRFRSLKLWFVLRSYGLEHLRQIHRKNIDLAKSLAKRIQETDDFELVTEPVLSLFCFRYKPADMDNENELNTINAKIMEQINDTGHLYLTHTKIEGRYVMRFVTGHMGTTQQHVDDSWHLITGIARSALAGKS